MSEQNLEEEEGDTLTCDLCGREYDESECQVLPGKEFVVCPQCYEKEMVKFTKTDGDGG